MSQPLLEIRNLSCHYQQQAIIQSLAFSINPGEICALLGPSGCGKTTVLRTIAGFHPVSDGQLFLNQKLIACRESGIAPEKRGIGFVFQDYALFPHLNVSENILFGLRKMPATRQKQLLDEALELVGLTALAERMPHELSGGQQQRVALARALAPEPGLLLLDEPFSNLDTHLRTQLSREVRQILKKKGISAILVTHDQHEAFAMADRIGVLNNGVLQQWDTPFQLYHEPANHFVATFIGRGSFIPGKALTPNCVETPLGDICNTTPHKHPAGTVLSVLIRPDDIVHCAQASLTATVVDKVFSGAFTLYTLELADKIRVDALFPSHQDHAPGEKIAIRLEADHLIAFLPGN